MATNALAVDTMMPALPAISRSVGMTGGENQQQWIVTAYLLGFGGAQIFYGTLSDRFGRKPILMFGLIAYAVFGVAAAASQTPTELMAARALQGVGAAATRVLAISIVRDRFSGSQMARVISLAYIVFLAVPVLAPSIGQIIVILFGSWRWIFGALATFGLVVTLWTATRLGETLHPEHRLPIVPRRILMAFMRSLTDRIAVGYMLAMTMMLGSLFAYINSAQQIFVTGFAAPRLLTPLFAFTAACMAVSSLLNSKIVGMYGPRRVSHAALVGFLCVSTAHTGVAAAGAETVWSFGLLQAGMMFFFGLVVSNFGALAMGPLGHVAGTASSVQGFVTTVGGALLGFLVGQQFDGTVLPLTVGCSICGGGALLIILFTERGRFCWETA